MSQANITNFKLSSRGGIKIVDNNSNKRVSDIFNTKSHVVYENPAMNKGNKQRMIEASEKLIDEKLRNKTPFTDGQRNKYYIPQHLNSSVDHTEKNYLKIKLLNSTQNSLTDLKNKNKRLNCSVDEISTQNKKKDFYKQEDIISWKTNEFKERKLKKSSSEILSQKNDLSFHVRN